MHHLVRRAGGEVQLEGLQIQNILSGAPTIDFGFRVNALRFGDIAAPDTIEGMLDFAREKLDIGARFGDRVRLDLVHHLETVLDELAKSAAGLQMGPEYRTGLLGKSKEMAKMFRSFVMAFIMAFLFVYLCIAAQFESRIAFLRCHDRRF